ncbi:hypothetical protein V8F20_009225 [Naviculisporaceae sp. PSN 640]
MADTSATFKVIIVGGGPVGLIAAHCLTKAGIAFEILEKRADSGYNAGTSSALWPQSVRVFDQLDLFDAVNKIQYPSKHKINLIGNGRVLNENDFYLEAGKAHGHPAMFLHRQELVDMLYEHLPGASKHVHYNKQVTGITTSPEPTIAGQEVTVTCSDGSTYHGSMVIGADGVYSTVRRLMNSKLGLPATGPKSNTEPMNTTYLGVFGSCKPLTIPHEAESKSSSKDAPTSDDGNGDSPQAEGKPMPADSFYETHGPKYAFQLGLHHTRTFFGVYHRIPTQPSSGSILPRREPYTEAEKEALAAQYADFHLSPWHTFSDAWKNQIWTHMAPLEEGVARIWFSGEDRIVLLGDSVHKHTPISGLGFNAGVQSAVVLTNLLHKALAGPGAIGKDELKSIFEQYQKRRIWFAKREADLSKRYTRAASWDNPLWKVLDRYILPRINGDTFLLKFVVSKIIKDSEVLDFVEEKNFREGHVKWKIGRVVLPKLETSKTA